MAKSILHQSPSAKARNGKQEKESKRGFVFVALCRAGKTVLTQCGRDCARKANATTKKITRTRVENDLCTACKIQLTSLDTGQKCRPCAATHIQKASAWQCHLRRYGLTLAEYNVLFESQGKVCAICQNPSSRRLAIDHCHVTGKTRALLCNTCNAGLGMFKDNTELLEKAVAYLKTHQFT